MMRIRLLISFFLLLAMGNMAADESAAASQRTPSSEGAAVSFLKLKDGDEVPPTFTVKFLISGMGVAPAGSKIDNTGHHHLLIDVPLPSDLSKPIGKDGNHVHMGDGSKCKTLDLAKGQHTITALFAQGNHVPYNPAVSDGVTVFVTHVK